MSGQTTAYQPETLSRADVDASQGLWLLEFGANGCPYCMAAQPFIRQALASRPSIRHIKIEDGRGRRLGRSFGIRLWPTLVLIRNGREVGRVTRPRNSDALTEILDLPD